MDVNSLIFNKDTSSVDQAKNCRPKHSLSMYISSRRKEAGFEPVSLETRPFIEFCEKS
jgi:hypothetical protein